MAYTLTDFEVNGFTWTEADESRPAVDLKEVPAELSERGKRVLAGNAKLRGVWDENADGFPSDSERAYSVAYHAGHAGLTIEDAAWLLSELYRRPGKKTLHRSKLQKTLRAWAKGREVAERDEQHMPAEPEREPGPESEAPGQETRHREPSREKQEAKPFEVLSIGAFMERTFTGATRLVPAIGLTERGAGLLVGPAGDGKSLLAKNLAIAWAGHPVPLTSVLPAARPLRILNVEVEDEPGIEQERYGKLLGSSPKPHGLLVFTRQEPIQFGGPKGRPNERALERLRATLRTHAPLDLVIFDPLVYLHESEENSVSEMARWLRPLREACRQEGVAILIVHHAGWAPDGEDVRGRGSTAIRAWSDLELSLRARTHEGRTVYRVNLVKSNFAPRWKQAITLELDEASLLFHPVDEAGTLCPPDALVAWLEEDHNGIWEKPRADLYAAIQQRFGCSERTAKEAVAKAMRAGKLKDQGQRKPLGVVAYSPEPLR